MPYWIESGLWRKTPVSWCLRRSLRTAFSAVLIFLAWTRLAPCLLHAMLLRKCGNKLVQLNREFQDRSQCAARSTPTSDSKNASSFSLELQVYRTSECVKTKPPALDYGMRPQNSKPRIAECDLFAKRIARFEIKKRKRDRTIDPSRH